MSTCWVGWRARLMMIKTVFNNNTLYGILTKTEFHESKYNKINLTNEKDIKYISPVK